jgi:tetratricopeptide (TPR) repeat protein
LVSKIIQLINRPNLLLVPALLLFMGGCASVTTQAPAQASVPQALPQGQGVIIQSATSQGVPAQTAIASPSVVDIIAEPAPKPLVSDNKAVIALLDRARLDNEAGQRDAAGASLERALRIEPRNAWLWHELAQLRLAQGQYAQAISLSQKSISFAGRERRLNALNWRVIGNARVAQGNPSGAEQALKLAAELEQ